MRARVMDEKGEGDRLSALVGTPLREIREEFISVAELQRRIMPDPDRLRNFGDYDLFGMTLPLAVIGGDFFDFIDLDERFDLQGKMGIVIADASGHGLTAAMLIRDFNTALYTGISFQSYYARDTTPFLFVKINRRMYRSSQENQFISAFYGELHLDGKLRYINAGHYGPLLLRGAETLTLDQGGPVLGAFPDLPSGYTVGEVHLDQNDVLVCYTDGIVEAENGQEEYGLARLERTVRAHGGGRSRQIFDAVVSEVENFSSEIGQQDDRTVIVIKKGKGSDD